MSRKISTRLKLIQTASEINANWNFVMKLNAASVIQMFMNFSNEFVDFSREVSGGVYQSVVLARKVILFWILVVKTRVMVSCQAWFVFIEQMKIFVVFVVYMAIVQE